MEQVLTHIGYSVEDKSTPEYPSRIVASHPDPKQFNLVVTVLRDERLAVFISILTPDKHVSSTDRKLLATLHAANWASTRVIVAVDSDGDLNVTSSMPLSARISPDDVHHFVKSFNAELIRIANSSGLVEQLT